jgi:hypothetical protein
MNARPKVASKFANTPKPEQNPKASAFSFMNEEPKPTSDIDAPPGSDDQSSLEQEASAFSFMNGKPKPTSDQGERRPHSDDTARKPHSDHAAHSP